MRTPTYIPVLIVTLAACGGATRSSSPTLPENIAVAPRGPIGIFAPSPTSALPTALRALGVQYRRLGFDDLDEAQLDGIGLVILDEGSFDDPAVSAALPRLFDHARTAGLVVVILAQSPEIGRDVMKANAGPIEPRTITHGVDLVAPHRDDRLLSAPNAIGRDDIEAYSDRTSQFARGRNGRAVLAGNLDRPDSSAALLGVAYGKGSMWYVAFPFVARAAEGYAADQRLLANLVSQ
jgi:hypothetical protein